jgi:putative addiction module component (TIGR02574 family)
MEAEVQTPINDIFQAALSLPPENRAALAEQLLQSLETSASDSSEIEEIDRRIDAYDRGEETPIPGLDVLRSLRSPKRP